MTIGARPVAVWAPVWAIGAVYIGSTLLTPLYPLYKHAFGVTNLTVTEIYAVYAVGNLCVLFFFGRISDQIGRRRTVWGALAILAVSAVLFLLAQNTAWLFPARIVNGFAAGLAAGALTAWLAELTKGSEKSLGAVLASSGNLAGLAAGAGLGGLFVEYLPAPLRWCWVFYLGLIAAAGLTLLRTPETVSQPVRSWRELSLRPRLGVPRELWLDFVPPAAIAFAAFAIGGFYAAIGPSILTDLFKETNLALVGALVALLFGVGSVAAATTRGFGSRPLIFVAIGTLFAGLALLILCERLHQEWLVFLAAGVCGLSMGLGYRGSLQRLNEIAPADHRAELVSSYLLVCYLANSLPVVGTGVLSNLIGPRLAHPIFAAVLAVVGLIAGLVGLFVGERAGQANKAGGAGHRIHDHVGIRGGDGRDKQVG